MKSKVFQVGSYVWECKSSYSDPGGAIDITYLKAEIADLEDRWLYEGKPSGYYYVFPINLVSNEAKRVLEKLKSSYRGEVDIDYYDRVDMQKLIQKLEKTHDMQALVNYIKQVWMG